MSCYGQAGGVGATPQDSTIVAKPKSEELKKLKEYVPPKIDIAGLMKKQQTMNDYCEKYTGDKAIIINDIVQKYKGLTPEQKQEFLKQHPEIKQYVKN